MMKWWGWGEPEKTYDLAKRPDFWPYLQKQLALRSERHTPPVRREDIRLPAPRDDNGFLAALPLPPRQIDTGAQARLTHAYGKSYRDLLRIRQGRIERAPDAILYPESINDVTAIVQTAREHRTCLVPFGGGTSVVGGVEAASPRFTATVDMTRMNRVLALDAASGTATVEAGILGPELEKQLQARGLTLGHYPQSFEFSSLGGWVATRSAGQQSNRYGKIEDMVVSLKMVTPAGTLQTLTVPASAAGLDLNHIAIGSEGIFGIITEVTVRVHPLPAIKDYRGVLVQNFEAGLRLIADCVRAGIAPAMIRLSDEAETAALMKLREPTRSLGKQLLNRGLKLYFRQVRHFHMQRFCLLLVGFEGEKEEVDFHRTLFLQRSLQGNAIHAGTGLGQHWYHSRFDLPYLRDVLMDRGLLIDTLETATVWTNLLPLYQAVRQALNAALDPGMVLCHVSHVYPEGASLYFTFLAPQHQGREQEQWQAAKTAASEAIAAAGGTLSHHHGVGYEHRPWMSREVSPTGVKALRALKAGLDPDDICNPGKLIPETDHA